MMSDWIKETPHGLPAAADVSFRVKPNLLREYRLVWPHSVGVIFFDSLEELQEYVKRVLADMADKIRRLIELDERGRHLEPEELASSDDDLDVDWSDQTVQFIRHHLSNPHYEVVLLNGEIEGLTLDESLEDAGLCKLANALTSIFLPFEDELAGQDISVAYAPGEAKPFRYRRPKGGWSVAYATVEELTLNLEELRTVPSFKP
jgi:hypothetical protein